MLVYNWALVDACINNRIVFKDGTYQFFWGLNTVAFLIFMIVYVFMIKLRYSQNKDVINRNYMLVACVVLFICFLNTYVVG